MAVRFTDTFAIRRGFLNKPHRWGEFVGLMCLEPGTKHFSRAIDAGTKLFGSARAMKTLGLELLLETPSRPIQEKITFVIERVGASRLGFFLCRVWGTEFALTGLDFLGDVEVSLSPSSIQNMLTMSTMTSKTMDMFFSEGILDGVSMKRPEGTCPTKRRLAAHVGSLMGGRHGHQVLKALSALFVAAGDVESHNVLYRNYARDLDLWL